jgi:hypothetical protein
MLAAHAALTNKLALGIEGIIEDGHAALLCHTGATREARSRIDPWN